GGGGGCGVSRDVSRTLRGAARAPGDPVFVRDRGQVRERDRTDLPTRSATGVVVSANRTHNRGRMADAAGLSRALWRPGEANRKTAQQLIEPLRQGLTRLRAAPDSFKLFDDAGGRVLYEDFLRWVEAYLMACVQYPEALVSVRRCDWGGAAPMFSPVEIVNRDSIRAAR